MGIIRNLMFHTVKVWWRCVSALSIMLLLMLHLNIKISLLSLYPI